MKNKLLTFTGLIVMVALLVTGCSKILDKKPIGEIDASTIDDPNAGGSITATEAEQLLSGAYNDMYWDGEEYWALTERPMVMQWLIMPMQAVITRPIMPSTCLQPIL